MGIVAASRRAAILCGLLVAWLPSEYKTRAAEVGSAKVTTKIPTTAERLVADALRAEVTGNSARRRVLLSEAIDAAPDFLPARWHSGQVLVGGEWLPVDKAQQAAAADPKRAEYQKLRAAGDESLAGQLALARWCRKNALVDEARFHWTSVLAHEPNNDEAQRALGMRWFAGRLLTYAQVDAAKAELRASQQAAKEFAPQVARWERLLAAGDIKSRDQALGEIRALKDVHAIPALEDVTLGERPTNQKRFERTMQIGLALVAALDKLPGQAATNSLVRHAALAPIKDVRTAAIEALKQRPPHDYVPMLLASLSMPIESTFRVATDDDGCVHYWHSLYREGPDANWSFEGRRSAMQHDLQGPTTITVDDRVRGEVNQAKSGSAANPAVLAEMAAVAAENRQRFGGQATAAEQQIAALNEATAAANRLIIPVLVATTGEDFGDNPRLWWDWWERYNEYSSDGETPVYEDRVAESTHRYYREPEDRYYRIDPPPPPRRHSCFARGTLVWTITGKREIETLAIGDLVLAQDGETGELAYKPVIGRTVRPPSPILKLRLEQEELSTTLGHPFWVAGVGWRMAKELGEGAILHGVNGPVQVAGMEEEEAAEAYNLVVADFSTYFVGQSGVFVHDNTPRQAITAEVPGLVRN